MIVRLVDALNARPIPSAGGIIAAFNQEVRVLARPSQVFTVLAGFLARHVLPHCGGL